MNAKELTFADLSIKDEFTLPPAPGDNTTYIKVSSTQAIFLNVAGNACLVDIPLIHPVEISKKQFHKGKPELPNEGDIKVKLTTTEADGFTNTITVSFEKPESWLKTPRGSLVNEFASLILREAGKTDSEGKPYSVYL